MAEALILVCSDTDSTLENLLEALDEGFNNSPASWAEKYVLLKSETFICDREMADDEVAAALQFGIAMGAHRQEEEEEEEETTDQN